MLCGSANFAMTCPKEYLTSATTVSCTRTPDGDNVSLTVLWLQLPALRLLALYRIYRRGSHPKRRLLLIREVAHYARCNTKVAGSLAPQISSPHPPKATRRMGIEVPYFLPQQIKR